MEQVLDDQADLMTLGSGAVVSDGRSIGGARFRAPTHYAPRPAPAAPEAVDYTTADSAPSLGRQEIRRPDLRGTSIPVDQRHDHRTLHKILAAREADDDLADMSTWDAIAARNSAARDGSRMVDFRKTPWTEPNVDYLGRSTRRPRSWR